uniref:Uncharacterized protein n=1 Tax=Tetradesmus obliquus TaxID=3088 RepID=A0A383W6X3_TETOB|eukprot:jgi/Sobl393_1/2023/SZX73395.1
MGRGIPSARPGAHASLLWHREINQQMLEEMWHSLVSLLHPALHSQPRSLDELFELLKDATWQDFFQVFPYELREHASYLGHDAYHDELDALALLLSSPQSKQRFQRYFEQYADVITSTAAPAAAAGSGRLSPAVAAAAVRAGGSRQRLRLGLPLMTAADEDAAAPVDGGQQQQQQHVQRQPQELPLVRHRGHQQQQQQQAAAAGPVAYVSPAAPDRLLAAAQPGWPHPPSAAAAAAAARLGQPAQQQQQQAGGAAENLVNAMLTAFGMTADDIAHLRANAHVAAAAAAAPGLVAAVPGAPTAAGAAGRLSGRRRTWLEACEPDAQPAAAAAAAGHAGTAGAARAQARHAAAAAQQQAAAAPGTSAAAAAAGAPTTPAAAAAAGNNSGVWRAVHEALTSDDEGLLQCVSRLVPYSFAGQLRDAAETAAQLKALAGSRPVPAQVVQAIAERLAASSSVQLVRVSAGSGYSRRAAAAAAVLACPSRKPFYVTLAGCCTHEDIEAAIMRGVFAAQQQQQQQQQSPQQQAGEAQQQPQGAPQPEQPEQQQQQQQQLHGALVLPPPPQQDQAPAAPAAAAAAAGAARAEYRWRLLDGDRLFWGPPQAAAAAAAAGGAPGPGGPPDEYLNFSDSEDERIEGDSEFDDVAEDGEEEDGTDRCAEALAARLTLLGMCSEQPLLMLLDEADAAMLQQGSGSQTGGMFRAMLLGVLRQLPQVVLVVTDSFEPDALLDSNSLRRQGRPAVYCLPDGKLSVTSYSISRATYYYSCVHNF